MPPLGSGDGGRAERETWETIGGKKSPQALADVVARQAIRNTSRGQDEAVFVTSNLGVFCMLLGSPYMTCFEAWLVSFKNMQFAWDTLKMYSHFSTMVDLPARLWRHISLHACGDYLHQHKGRRGGELLQDFVLSTIPQ